MSARLHDFIRAVRQCRTMAQERALVAREAAALRSAFKEQDNAYRHRNVAKLMFMHMLGYPTHFGQLECLKLIAEENFADKRVGYLSLGLLLDEKQEVLMLVTNSMKNDLHSTNQFVAGLALCALGGVGSAEMCRDLASEVARLLGSQSSYVRKKACLAAVRIVKKAPEVAEQFMSAIPALLSDRHHGVLLAAVSLCTELCTAEPSEYTPRLRKEIPIVTRLFQSLVSSGFASEHDVAGVPDPFLQVAMLRLLRLLGEDDVDASEQMADLLANVASNTGTGGGGGGGSGAAAKQVVHSILYECVRTIMAVKSASGLRVLAINVLGKFLQNRDNNIRYVSLSLLAQCVKVDVQAVQRHRAMVVECVKDADMSIRRRALDLVYALVNESNAPTLTKELLEYLHVADPEFKGDLVEKLCHLAAAYAPDVLFHVETVCEVMLVAGEHVKEGVVRNLVAAVSGCSDDATQGKASCMLVRALEESKRSGRVPGALACACCWFVGEYGDLLATGGVTAEDAATLVEWVAAADLRDLTGPLAIFSAPYAVTSLAKLGVRVPALKSRVEAALAKSAQGRELEVQARSVELGALMRRPGGAASQALDRMPPLSIAGVASGVLEEAPVGGGGGGGAADLLGDLLGGEMNGGGGGGGGGDLLGGAGAPAAAAGDLLGGLDLLGGGGAAPASVGGGAGAGGADLLGDLLGGGATMGAGGGGGAMDMLGGGAPLGGGVTAFEKDGVKIVMEFKPDGADAIEVAARFSNTNASQLDSFVMQVAVPKSWSVELRAASAAALPPLSDGAVTQNLRATKTAADARPLALRLRVAYTKDGAQIVEMGQVNAPPM